MSAKGRSFDTLYPNQHIFFLKSRHFKKSAVHMNQPRHVAKSRQVARMRSPALYFESPAGGECREEVMKFCRNGQFISTWCIWMN